MYSGSICLMLSFERHLIVCEGSCCEEPRPFSTQIFTAPATHHRPGGYGVLAPAARASTITVNTTGDELNEDGDCSLREAIRATNLDQAVDGCPAGNGADTILVPQGTYAFALPGVDEDEALTGDLDIREDLTIVGAGRRHTIIDANGLDRVFQIALVME